MSEPQKPNERAIAEGTGNNEMNKSNPNHEVGFGRPPKEYRFKPGQSGNPAGRPKSTFLDDLAEELSQFIAVSENSSITKSRAIAKMLVTAAIDGNIKVAIALIGLAAKSRHDATDAGAAEDDAFVEKLAAGKHRDAEDGASPDQETAK